MAILSLLLLVTTTHSFNVNFINQRHQQGSNTLARLERGYDSRDNCGNVRCRKPRCSEFEVEYTPNNECCPKCVAKKFKKPHFGYDKYGYVTRCNTITCDIVCRNDEEYYTPKDRCCPVCRQKNSNGNHVFTRGRNIIRNEEILDENGNPGYDPVDRFNLLLPNGMPGEGAVNRYLGEQSNPIERYGILIPGGIPGEGAVNRYLSQQLDPVNRYNILVPGGNPSQGAVERYLSSQDPAERYFPPNQPDRLIDHQGYRDGLLFIDKPTRAQIEEKINKKIEY